MRRAAWWGLVLAACGAPTSTPTVVPVKSTPLAGTIGGAPWTARSAVASARRAFDEDGGRRWIDLGAGSFGCADFVPHAEIIGTVPWEAAAYELSLRNNLTFVVRQPDGGIDNLVATTGRVELLSAPGPDAGPATLRLRAKFGADNDVEGEIAVTVCD